MERTFLSWAERPLRALADPPPVGAARLAATAPLELADLTNSVAPATGGAPFELLGPGDVVRLSSGAITRRYPAPGAVDAEETKAALVELQPDDLPWRYTPERRDGQKLRPWLALVVGPRRADELTLTADGRVGLGPIAQQAHPLTSSWRTAHVHVITPDIPAAPNRIARILCLRDLEAHTDYTACLVPAFVVERDGRCRDAWPQPGGGTAWLPCFDSWAFRTGEEGDFPQLAGLLHMATFEPGEAFGTAAVTYDAVGNPVPPPDLDALSATLSAQGALRLPDAQEPPPPDGWVADEVAELTRLTTIEDRWVLHAPMYEERFAALAAAPPATGWGATLHHDPRARGNAGLGAWAATAWQDRIADAGAAKAGDLAIARDRVGHLALGLEASRSLWRRHVPTDPVAALQVLGCGLGRLPVEGGGTVLGAVSGRTPLFARALWSSAARRALRPGPARTSRAAAGAADFGAVLDVARRCPEPVPDPTPEILEKGGHELVAVTMALRGLFGDDRNGCSDVDIGALGGAVVGAIDPTVDRPVVVDRVLGTLDGVDDLGPVEIEPELDLPLWSFLANEAPDWLLPGIGALEPNEVVGLATNPAFVEAMLVGANTQAIGELEFRNVPLRSRWSPLRKFWQRGGGELDIEPIKTWPEASDFGGAGLQPPGIGAEAVVMFRTSLFRRYPGTVVYLMSGGAPWNPPEEDETFPQEGRIMPTFTGRVGADVVFFGFRVAPSALATHWVVLEEPPTGYRFYLEDPSSPPVGAPPRRARAVIETDFRNAATAPNAAEYGYDTFAVPVRVMIGELIDGGA